MRSQTTLQRRRGLLRAIRTPDINQTGIDNVAQQR
jgi:hypothetical protein